MYSTKIVLAKIFNEIKCHVNTSLGLVGECIPCIPPCVRACFQVGYFIQELSFVTPVRITQTATRVGPNYTLHSRN